jgi:hypothetical protein
MIPDRRVVPGRPTRLSVEDNRVGDLAGARWKRFLLNRATASEREAARPRDAAEPLGANAPREEVSKGWV